MRAFLDLERKLPTLGGEVERSRLGIVSLMRRWVRGNLDWSRQTARYAAGTS